MMSKERKAARTNECRHTVSTCFVVVEDVFHLIVSSD